MIPYRIWFYVFFHHLCMKKTHNIFTGCLYEKIYTISSPDDYLSVRAICSKQKIVQLLLFAYFECRRFVGKPGKSNTTG